MLDKYIGKKEERVLILNTPFLLSYNDFYMNFFRVPEIFNRIKQYREILKKHDLSIPVWVYCSTENVKNLKGTPRISVLNFLASLGLLDRYIKKQGWPSHVIGAKFLVSSFLSQDDFEKWALYFTHNNYAVLNKLALYKSHFFLPKVSFSHLEHAHESSSMEDLIVALDPSSSLFFQLIAPNDQKVKNVLKGLNVGHFLERDPELRWLWPVWKKNEISYKRRKQPAKRSL